MSSAYILLVWNVSLERAATPSDEPNETSLERKSAEREVLLT